jgi:hypothetical protein
MGVMLTRLIYAFYATTVFSAVLLIPLGLCAAVLLPTTAIAPKTAVLIAGVVPAILFPICYIYAPILRARMPISRT